MKRFRIFTLLLLLSAAFYACSKENDNDPPGDPDDDSPGIDEYFRMHTGTELWEANSDENIGAVVTNFTNSGAKISLSATRMSDSTHCFFSVPYFYGPDTTISSLPSPDNFGLQFHYMDQVYLDYSGTLSIQRSIVNGYRVYDGTFNMQFEETFGGHDSITLSNGSFKVARLL